jgi:hypothetical protein
MPLTLRFIKLKDTKKSKEEINSFYLFSFIMFAIRNYFIEKILKK